MTRRKINKVGRPASTPTQTPKPATGEAKSYAEALDALPFEDRKLLAEAHNKAADDRRWKAMLREIAGMVEKSRERISELKSLAEACDNLQKHDRDMCYHEEQKSLAEKHLQRILDLYSPLP